MILKNFSQAQKKGSYCFICQAVYSQKSNSDATTPSPDHIHQISLHAIFGFFPYKKAHLKSVEAVKKLTDREIQQNSIY